MKRFIVKHTEKKRGSFANAKLHANSLRLFATIMAILAFSAISCSQDVEITAPEWKEVNAGYDETKGGNAGALPTAAVVDRTGTTTITEFEIAITIGDTKADILRGKVDTAALQKIISFHTFTKATENYTADTLEKAGDFTLVPEKTQGNTFTVKLATNITVATSSDLIMRIDGKAYTYARGLRHDFDTNGRIESPYDDAEYAQVTGFTGGGTGLSFGDFTPVAWEGPYSVGLPTLDAAISTTGSSTFSFAGTETTTNSGTVVLFSLGYSAVDTTQARYEDRAAKLVPGIKLQKLNGKSWSDVKGAEYIGQSDVAALQGRVVLNDVSFQHDGIYRLRWTGSSYLKTSKPYYGAPQYLYFSTGTGTRAGKLARTEVVTEPRQFRNGDPEFGQYVTTSVLSSVERYSMDSEGKNVVLRAELLLGRIWNTVSLGEFKKNFHVVAVRGSTPAASSLSTNGNLITIDVSKIEYADELDRTLYANAPAGNNVLYITLDPKFSIDSIDTQVVGGLYFKVNNKLSIKDGTETYLFGTSNPLQDYWDYYGDF